MGRDGVVSEGEESRQSGWVLLVDGVEHGKWHRVVRVAFGRGRFRCPSCFNRPCGELKVQNEMWLFKSALRIDDKHAQAALC